MRNHHANNSERRSTYRPDQEHETKTGKGKKRNQPSRDLGLLGRILGELLGGNLHASTDERTDNHDEGQSVSEMILMDGIEVWMWMETSGGGGEAEMRQTKRQRMERERRYSGGPLI
jgi:hypothetical protein